MEIVKTLFVQASKAYNSNISHQLLCLDLVKYCLSKLETEAKYQFFGNFAGRAPVPYSVFQGTGNSRPVRSDLFFEKEAPFFEAYSRLVNRLQTGQSPWSTADETEANRVIYTAVMSVACCFDIWQRNSRKTPGTFFEVFIAGLLKLAFPLATLSKHIPLLDILEDSESGRPALASELLDEDEKGSVATDIVIGTSSRRGGVVLPLKITTRERIVQPFAHQRILDSAFGRGVYQSLIVCISETQLDEKSRSVKQVCVPGTIKLYQKYLAPIGGLYYCDVPQRYAQDDVAKVLPVRSLGQLFADIRLALEKLNATKSAEEAGPGL